MSEQLPRLLLEWQAAFLRDPIHNIVDLYAPDASFWGTFSPVHRIGHKQIQEYFDDIGQLDQRELMFESCYVIEMNDALICSGYYQFSWQEDSQAVIAEARYSMTLLYADKRWLIKNHHSSKLPE